ncbi:hypothetical protein LuPra_00896 [Luteitalea pratensis]|uniref:Uncharacterized protein n=1 Tax=Luteitalea pratensis TaxID=1855912 RepID=A0A143PH23_LUTPR|nr:hypothetical protein [Luteitalea pratensis]AMY07716.1 hypothetical protein LuPra_00896 [Luteitalea pratensis]
MMLRRVARAAPGTVVAVLLGIVCHATVRERPIEVGDPRTVLREQLQLSDADLSALVQGRAIAKTLTSSAPREMTTAGGVRIRGSAMARFVSQFKTLEGFRTSQFVLQIEKFGQEPHVRDLDTLTLDPEDVESLRTCRVGACDVQLSADDIRRFSLVNWRSTTAARDAASLYRTILFEHLVRYRATGTKGLAHYQDREPGVSLAHETQSLLDARPSLLDHATGLREHIRQYPSHPDPHTEDFFYWSKEVFGFKPVVGLNHVGVHTDPTSGRVTILTIQIYASHYIEGSLGINALMPDRGSKETAFYWVYVNRARVGRLGGLLGTIARPIVQHRARSGLMKSLVQTKQRFEAAGGVPSSQ